jgi:hypothetical protein
MTPSVCPLHSARYADTHTHMCTLTDDNAHTTLAPFTRATHTHARTRTHTLAYTHATPPRQQTGGVSSGRCGRAGRACGGVGAEHGHEWRLSRGHRTRQHQR